MKVVRNIILTVGFLCMGGVFTSCDENTLTQLLPIITELFKPGTVYSYTGTANTESYRGASQTDGWHITDYINGTEENKKGTYEFKGMQINLTESQTGITLAIPAYSENNNKVVTSDITISGLVATLSNDQSYNTLSLGESSIKGTMTCDGVTYDTANLYIEEAIASANYLKLNMTIYFQAPDVTDDYATAIKFTYTGSIISQ
ncbi:MAG: hypothetical protein K2H79_08560 [Bacteroidaceae bacterium]|nr:hypothetical protein [Bacteroidaceae bacterium]